MNSIRKIAPIVLLSIFSLTLLHTILPHIHHVHELEHAITDHDVDHHHDDIDTNHHHENKSGDHHNDLDFFNHFLESHAHNAITDEVIVLAQYVKTALEKTTDDSTKILPYTFLLKRDLSSITSTINDIYVLKSVRKPLLTSLSLRGPPAFI
ncbi:hypothetical protein [Aquimarina rhabdastrellae]